MNLPSTGNPREEASRHRLDRLEGFLKEDPANTRLLADAFEVALQCGEWDRARFHLAHGAALVPDDGVWKLREADLLLAQREYEAAIELLHKLERQENPALCRVVVQNLAFARFQQGRYADCIELLRPLAAGSPPQEPSLQRLWLRALHRTGQLELAVQWAAGAEQVGGLDAGAAGIASLMAFDLDDYAAAQRWEQLARSAAAGASLEGLVTRAGLALAQGKPQEAIAAADAALTLNREEGRAWSLRAFALLVAGQAEEASKAFALAVQYLPGHSETWQGQGWCQLLSGQLPAAQASFESAVCVDDEAAAGHGGLAMALALQQQEVPARAALARALQLDPADQAAACAKAILDGQVDGNEATRRLVGGLFKPPRV